MENEIPTIKISGPGFVYAPIVEGQYAATAYVCLGEKTIGKIKLTFGETVEQKNENPPSFINRLFGGEVR